MDLSHTCTSVHCAGRKGTVTPVSLHVVGMSGWQVAKPLIVAFSASNLVLLWHLPISFVHFPCSVVPRLPNGLGPFLTRSLEVVESRVVVAGSGKLAERMRPSEMLVRGHVCQTHVVRQTRVLACRQNQRFIMGLIMRSQGRHHLLPVGFQGGKIPSNPKFSPNHKVFWQGIKLFSGTEMKGRSPPCPWCKGHCSGVRRGFAGVCMGTRA